MLAASEVVRQYLQEVKRCSVIQIPYLSRKEGGTAWADIDLVGMFLRPRAEKLRAYMVAVAGPNQELTEQTALAIAARNLAPDVVSHVCHKINTAPAEIRLAIVGFKPASRLDGPRSIDLEERTVDLWYWDDIIHELLAEVNVKRLHDSPVLETLRLVKLTGSGPSHWAA